MPPPPLDRSPAELRPWLRRLHETVADLARALADQEARLDRLTRQLETLHPESAPTAPAHRWVEHPAPGPSPLWKRLAGRLVRAPSALLRRFRSASRSGWILPVADSSAAPPSLRLGDDVVVLERRGQVADLPAGYLELALLQMAMLGLEFCQLRGSTRREGPRLDLWLCRSSWPWREVEDLERPLARVPGRQNVLGRRIELELGPFPEPPPPAVQNLDMLGEYWLRPGTRDQGNQLRCATSFPKRQQGRNARSAAGKTAFVFSRPLDSGLEVLIAALLRHLRSAGQEVLLFSVCDLRSSLRSLEDVAPAETRLYPLATFAPPELRGIVLALLLEREDVTTLLHIGPGEGFCDEPALADLPERCRVFDLPLPRQAAAALPLVRPPGFAERTLTLVPQSGAICLPPPLPRRGLERGNKARLAARERLGLPTDGFLVFQIADLVVNERPEDLVELAARVPGMHFIQVGRGALAGRRDDLIRFRGVQNLRGLQSADLAEALAAADVLLALGEPSLWPWPVFAAFAQGVPVVGRPAGTLAGFAAAMITADSPAEIAARLEAMRRGEIPQPAAPEPGEEVFEAALAALFRHDSQG